MLQATPGIKTGWNITSWQEKKKYAHHQHCVALGIALNYNPLFLTFIHSKNDYFGIQIVIITERACYRWYIWNQIHKEHI